MSNLWNAVLDTNVHLPFRHSSFVIRHSVGVWSHESYVAHRAKRASREAFDAALAEVPDAPPLSADTVVISHIGPRGDVYK